MSGGYVGFALSTPTSPFSCPDHPFLVALTSVCDSTLSPAHQEAGESPFPPSLPIQDRWSLPASPQLSFLHGVLSGSVCSQGSPVGLFPHCLLPPLPCPSLTLQAHGTGLEMKSKVMSSSSYAIKTAQPRVLAQNPGSVVMESFSC